MNTYDMALTSMIQANGKTPRVYLVFPVALARQLMERGYDRARVEVTEEGILVRPYVRTVEAESVPLPDWGEG